MKYVLTYDAPHRKSQDLLNRLKALGHEDLTVLASRWQERAGFSPLVPHRPPLVCRVEAEAFTRRLGYRFERVEIFDLPAYFDRNPPELILIGGAGILPAEVVGCGKVINSHPAYLPFVRGLDALKWAIYEELPIGVTTHVVDRETDAGFLLRQQLVPIYHWDTFHSLAFRQYEMEIELLAQSIQDFLDPDLDRIYLDPGSHPVRRRMPHSHEARMLKRFQERVDSVAIQAP